MPKPDRFGSPFDPNNKLPLPGSDKSEKLEQEVRQVQLRGCGDPSCAMCNPELAAMSNPPPISRRAITGGPPPSSMARPAFDDVLRAGYARAVESARNQMADAIGQAEIRRGMVRAVSSSGFTIEFTEENEAPKPVTKEPPESYNDAREKVEKWLITAPEQSFDDIFGNEEALEQLRDAIQAPVTHKELYEAYGIKMPNGALLSGPPGCGKTMFARAAAYEMQKLYGGTAEFLCINSSDIQSPYVGVTEGHISAIFKFAREYKAHHGHPLLVFIDEAEVLLPDRTGRIRRVASWEESQVATFLAEMDGILESGAFVLLATNRPKVIDQAVLRDGRCDFKITVKRPNYEAVLGILKRTFKGVPVSSDTTVDELITTAAEGLFDPHKVLIDGKVISINLKEREIREEGARHFLLEHIVSGAMATSVPQRAKRIAFSRDKAGGTVTGITTADVSRAVNDLFEENKGLEHEFALAEFRDEMLREAQAKLSPPA